MAAIVDRSVWVRVHRWVGLVLAGFLLLAGLTGALLAWYPELDRLAASRLYTAGPAHPGHASAASAAAAGPSARDPFAMREELAAAYPAARVHDVDLRAAEPGEAAVFYLQPPAGEGGRTAALLANDEIFVDRTTGRVIGERRWGDIGQGLRNLMPFVYRLHYQLALGTVGTTAFGIVALLWTIDCFVGACLTFPPRRPGRGPWPRDARGWWARWRPAWTIRRGAGSARLAIDLHRTSGLWPWAMLFVFAWSGVAFNLGEVYKPVMKLAFTFEDVDDVLPALETPQPEPALPWRDAHALARQHMASEGRRLGFSVIKEQSLGYDADRATYRYTVQSTADIRDRYGSTSLFIDANTGALRHTSVPTGNVAGNTVTHWLTSLHMAQVWGVPFRIFVCAMGLVVALLSGTGLFVWWRKRRARRALRGVRRQLAGGVRPVGYRRT